MSKIRLEFLKSEWQKTNKERLGNVIFYFVMFCLIANSVGLGIVNESLAWYLLAMWQLLYTAITWTHDRTIKTLQKINTLQNDLIERQEKVIKNINEIVNAEGRPIKSTYFQRL